MIAEIKALRQVCDGDFRKIKNYYEAINDSKYMWHLHHKLGLNHSIQELKDNNLYYHRPPEELEFLCTVKDKNLDTYDNIKTHSGAHADAKRRIESEFEFRSFVNELSRKQCIDSKVLNSLTRFEEWISGILRYEMLSKRLSQDMLEDYTGLKQKFIDETLEI